MLVGCERQARTHPATYRSCAQTDYPDVNRDSRSTEWIKKLSAPYERVRDFFRPQLQFGILNVRQELGAGLSLKVNAFGRHFKAEQFNVSLIDDNTRGFTDTTSAGGTLQLSHQGKIAARANQLVAGLEYVYNDASSKVFAEKNERTLAGCVQEATEQSLRVPEDLSIVGFDGIEATAWTNPALTTVEQPIEEIAETAVNALRSLIAEPEKPLPDYSFRPTLNVRGSTAPPQS